MLRPWWRKSSDCPAMMVTESLIRCISASNAPLLKEAGNGIVRNLRQTIGRTPCSRATDSMVSAASSLVHASGSAGFSGIREAGKQDLLTIGEGGMARLVFQRSSSRRSDRDYAEAA